MFPILLLTLFRPVLVVTERGRGRIVADSAGATELSWYPLPASNERTKNKEQSFKEHDSRGNVTCLFLAHILLAEPSRMETLRRQFQKARPSTRKPGKTSVYLRSLTNYLTCIIHANISSYRTPSCLRTRVKDVLSETNSGMKTKDLMRRIMEIGKHSNSSGIKNKMYREIVNEFLTDFRYFLSPVWDGKRGFLLVYASSDMNHIVNCLEKYNQSKRNERKLLEVVVIMDSGTIADEIVACCNKTLRKHVERFHVKLSRDLRRFCIKDLEALKRNDQHNFMDLFLDGPSHRLEMKSSERLIRLKRFVVFHDDIADLKRSEKLSIAIVNATTTKATEDNANKVLSILIFIIISLLIFAVIGCVCTCLWVYQKCRPTKKPATSEGTPLKTLTTSSNPAPKKSTAAIAPSLVPAVEK